MLGCLVGGRAVEGCGCREERYRYGEMRTPRDFASALHITL